MNLSHLKDQELLTQTQHLVKNERKLLTQILHHLKEVGRRKLFSELGYQSLFEYAVKELHYSEGQAGRRIQAIKLINEIPEVEEKIRSGKLSLSNVSQAQSFFRQSQKTESIKSFKTLDKKKILNQLESKSTRDGQKILLKLQPQVPLPKEREKPLTEQHTEMRFVMTASLKAKFEDLRALIGPKGSAMNFAELLEHIVDDELLNLRQKKFGKRRTAQNQNTNTNTNTNTKHHSKNQVTIPLANTTPRRTPAHDKNTPVTPAPELRRNKNERYISQALRLKIWKRDNGCCKQCGSKRNLHIDHILPIAMGGKTIEHNLRLLCFHCNQRAAIKTFGLEKMTTHFSPKRQSRLPSY